MAWSWSGGVGVGGEGHDTESMRCWASDKTSLCLPTWASSLGKQKQGRTILPVHGGIVMVSVLQTMSSVIYSIFLLRKGFPWPAPCQVVWRKDELPGLTRAASAGCKDTTAGLVSAGLPVPWPQPAFPHQDRDHYAIQSPPFPHPGQQALPALPEMSWAPGHRSALHSLGVRVWARSLTKPRVYTSFWEQGSLCHSSRGTRVRQACASKNNWRPS